MVVTYNYDPAGNRTSVVRTSPGGGGFSATIPMTGTGPVNLRSLADANGYNGAQNATVTYTLASGVTITGAAGSPNGGVGIDTGTRPTGSHTITLTLQVSGAVHGGGGQGGKGACPGNGAVGGTGGDALSCSAPLSVVVNAGGEIKAGGGGGGGGGGRWRTLDPPFDKVGGGGGGGFPNGPGGEIGSPGMDEDSTGAANGSAGSVSGGGAGGSGETSGGGAGGAGGGAGASGSAGGVGSGAGTTKTPGGGGAAGFAIRKNGHAVTVTNNGTITGTVG